MRNDRRIRKNAVIRKYTIATEKKSRQLWNRIKEQLKREEIIRE